MMGTVPPKLRIEFIRWAAEWTHGELGPELINSNVKVEELHEAFVLRLDLVGVGELFMRRLGDWLRHVYPVEDDWLRYTHPVVGRHLFHLDGWCVWFSSANVRNGGCDLYFGVSKLPRKPKANEPIKPSVNRSWHVGVDKGLADPIQATLRAYEGRDEDWHDFLEANGPLWSMNIRTGLQDLRWLGPGVPSNRAYVPTYCEGWEQCVEDDAA